MRKYLHVFVRCRFDFAFFLLFLFSLILFKGELYAQHRKVEPVFELSESRAIIEGMTYDSIDKTFYFGESIQKRILKYSFTGKRLGYIDAKSDGMTSVLGMTVDSKTHQLWICGAIDTGSKMTMCLFRYGLDDGKLISKYPDTSGKARLFNDVAITSDGQVYATDSYGRSIYKADMDNNISVLFIRNDTIRDPNGISANGMDLFISTFPGIAKVNTATKAVSRVTHPDFMIAGSDGLYYFENSVVGIQNVFYPTSIVRYYFNDQQTEVVRGELLSAAHPSFAIPTTGAVLDGYLYFMANNNLRREGEEKLKKVTLARIRL